MRRARGLQLGVLMGSLVFARPMDAVDLETGGTLGFGLTLDREAGAFRWDFDSEDEPAALGEIKLGARWAPGFVGFARLAARPDDVHSGRTNVFRLREASLRSNWRPSSRDSIGLRFFANQPSGFWLDHPLHAPVDWRGPGSETAQGVRLDAAGPGYRALVVAADRGAGGLAVGSETRAAEGALVLVRLRADRTAWAGLRMGATWVRHLPNLDFSIASPELQEARRRDFFGLDVRSSFRGVLAFLEYSEIHARFDGTGAVGAQEPGLRSTWRFERSRRLTDILPTRSAFRAELRTSRLGNERWGTFGLAPSYRALGAHHTNRLGASERDWGSPRRGLEGHRIEVWYELPVWPARLRQVYDRHTQFRDADRNVRSQTSEIELRLTERLRGRARYVQLAIREHVDNQKSYRDDLVAELLAEDGASRVRVQGGVLDLNTRSERLLIAVEASARVTSRIQVLGRVASASRGPSTRRSLFAELQYWHLPQFEIALQYGPEWLGDRADPVLDADLATSGAIRELVRLHFRGWF